RPRVVLRQLGHEDFLFRFSRGRAGSLPIPVGVLGTERPSGPLLLALALLGFGGGIGGAALCGAAKEIFDITSHSGRSSTGQRRGRTSLVRSTRTPRSRSL